MEDRNHASYVAWCGIAKKQKMNHYEILEVSKNATKKEIDSAFRKKSLLCHPDKHANIDDPEKREMFHRIEEARRILTDEEERRKYDRKLEEDAMGESCDEQTQRAQREFVQAYFRRLAEEMAREQARQHEQKLAEERVSESLGKGCVMVIVVPICLIVVLGVFINITSTYKSTTREQFSSSKSKPTGSGNEKIVGRVIAIDFGTSYSRVGVYVNGSIEVILNEQGNRLTPSFISFNSHCDVFIGELAEKQLVTNPENTISNLKRLIGRRSSDLYVKKYSSTFNLLKSQPLPQVKISCEMKSRYYSMEELTALLFGKLKADAEAFLGELVTNVVLTVPAQFNDLQRQMTKDAGAIAGLNVVKLINEPTAAMLWYGLVHRYKGQQYSLVFDLGGGTLDVTLFSSSGDHFEVLATSGNTQFGGSDFNTPVVEHFASVFGNKTGMNIHTSTTALLKISREVEMVKRSFCTKENSIFPLKIESLYRGHDLRETISMSQFEELNKANLQSLLKPVKQVLKAADIKKNEVGEIMLVGGSTCLSAIQNKLKTFFDGKIPTKIDKAGVAVLYGAVMMSANLAGEKDISEFVILDVNPFSLCVGTTDGTNKLIDRYSYTLSSGSEIFMKQRTQEVLTINVYEGEHRITRHNNYLGSFQLSGVAYGAEKFEVVFHVDTNGILKVSAFNIAKFKNQFIKVKNDALRYTDEEIETMHNNVHRILMADKRAKNRIFVRNELERYVYFLLKEMKFDNKISYEDSQMLNRVIGEEIIWVEEHQDVKRLFYLQRRRELELKIDKVFKKYKDIKNPTKRFTGNTDLVEKNDAHAEL